MPSSYLRCLRHHGSLLAWSFEQLSCGLCHRKLANQICIQRHDRAVFLGELQGFFFRYPVEHCQQNPHKTGVRNHGNGTFCCCFEQESTLCTHPALKLLQWFPTRSGGIGVSFCPDLCQDGIARFDFAPGKAFPLAELDFAQAGTNLKSYFKVRGNRLRRLSGTAKIASIDSSNRILRQPIQDSGELLVTALIELRIRMATEPACHISFRMTN